jgi:hypothetical protein
VERRFHDAGRNGGLLEPLIVRGGSLEVLEGNSLLAAYRQLAAKEPIKWAMVKCTVLPADVDDSLVFALLGQFHIKGKKDWAPYEQCMVRRVTARSSLVERQVCGNVFGL